MDIRGIMAKCKQQKWVPNENMMYFLQVFSIFFMSSVVFCYCLDSSRHGWHQLATDITGCPVSIITDDFLKLLLAIRVTVVKFSLQQAKMILDWIEIDGHALKFYSFQFLLLKNVFCCISSMFGVTILLENALPSGFFNDGVMKFSKTSIFSWAFVVPLMNFISPTPLGFMHPHLSKLPSPRFTVRTTLS